MGDLKFALRQLLKRPGFTIVAVLSLGLGIGANTAIFGFLNELLFKPLPVKDPGSLMALTLFEKSGGRIEQSISYPIYRDYVELNRAFSNTIAFAPLFTRVNAPDGRAPILAHIVSENFFHALGVKTALGRAFFPHQREDVAVISHEHWTK